MPKKKSESPIKRIILIVSGLSFIGSTLFLFVNLLRNPTTRQETEIPNQPSIEEQLEQQAEGYELVLEREPENVTALQGLVDIRLQQNDLEGAIPPLKQLIELYPEDESLKLLLSNIEQNINSNE